mgnify:CR=1 FL=1
MTYNPVEILTESKFIGYPVFRGDEMVTEFQKKLEQLINEHNMESESNTADFLLAQFLVDCLAAFVKTTNNRDIWNHPSKEQEENQTPNQE